MNSEEPKKPASLLEGMTDADLALHPMCNVCGWRKGGLCSWNGARCKCGLWAPSFRELFTSYDQMQASLNKAKGQ